MRDASADSAGRTVSRRRTLQTIGGALSSLALVGSASASNDDWINVVERGADPSGEESINPVLDDISLTDSTTLFFPEGDYVMDDEFRHTGFEGFELRGDEATIAPMDHYEGRWLFKLGTYESPGTDLLVDGFTFDFTADGTGLRVVQAQVDDGLVARNLTVEGRHDSGRYGPFLFDVTDPSGIGTVENLRLPDGGDFSRNTKGDISVGPTGLLVSPYHEGKLWVRNCVVGPWPDNGLYCSTVDGRVVVKGGTYKNSNVASIRLSGDHSYVRDATVVIDRSRTGDENQRGIRLDGGKYLWVEGTEVVLERPNGRAISVHDDVERARIQNSRVVVRGDTPTKAVTISPDSGRVDVIDSEIEFDTPGQALNIEGPGHDDADPVLVLRTSVLGTGDGSHGRHAVRAERGNCTFDRFDVRQTGGNFRRGIKVLGDGCTFVWGDHHTTHIPIVNDADGTTFRGVTSESLEGYEAAKFLGGSDDVTCTESTLYNGVWEKDGADVTYDGNWYPSS